MMLRRELDEARAELDKLAAWEPLQDDAHNVTLVGGEGAYEYPFWAMFAEDFRARQYVEWLATTETPEDESGQERYTVELSMDDGRLAGDAVAFWNSTDNTVLPTTQATSASRKSGS